VAALAIGAIILTAACSGTPAPSATVAATAPASAAATAAPATAEPTAAPTAGEVGVLKVMSDWTGTDQVKFEAVIKAFTEKTKINVQLEGSTDFLTVLRTRVAAGDLPMVAIVPRPGVFADFAKQGLIKPLDEIGVTGFADAYQPAWVDLGSVDGKPYAITVKANSKSMIWNRPKDLAAAGGAPATLDAFKALLDKGAVAGRKPLVISGKDSWTMGDWFENIYLRTAGPEKYAALFGGTQPFTDQSVVDALAVMDGLIGNEAWLNGGRDIALSTSYQDGLAQVFGTNPTGDYFMEGGFTGSVVINDVNTALKAGDDISFFPFPSIDALYQNAVVGGGDFAIAFVDNDASRQFMAYLASADAANVWATQGVISPNKGLDMGGFADPLVQAEAQQLTAAGIFQFDGTDLMPGALGNDWNTAIQAMFQDPTKIADLLATFEQGAAAEFGR
jgi:alpha-glucoside transport system substrate-binding protein